MLLISQVKTATTYLEQGAGEETLFGAWACCSVGLHDAVQSHNLEHEALCMALSPAACAQKLGFGIVATRGTAAALQEAGVQAETVLKIQEGRPNAADLMKARRRPNPILFQGLQSRFVCSAHMFWPGLPYEESCAASTDTHP